MVNPRFYLFINEIKVIKDLKERISGREVFDTAGKPVGKVSKILLSGTELSAIIVGRKRIGRDEIKSIADERITVELKLG